MNPNKKTIQAQLDWSRVGPELVPWKVRKPTLIGTNSRVEYRRKAGREDRCYSLAPLAATIDLFRF